MDNDGKASGGVPPSSGPPSTRRTGPGRAAWRHLFWAAVLLLPLLTASLLPVPNPSEGVFCLLRRVSGFPCMTCGYTRAFVRVCHGQWLEALADCPLGVVPPLLLAFAAAAHLASLLPGRRIFCTPPALTKRRKGFLFALLALLALANWAYRLARGCA